jgi:hypothetical protein
MARLVGVRPIDPDKTEEGANDEFVGMLVEVLSELGPVEKS